MEAMTLKESPEWRENEGGLGNFTQQKGSLDSEPVKVTGQISQPLNSPCRQDRTQGRVLMPVGCPNLALDLGKARIQNCPCQALFSLLCPLQASVTLQALARALPWWTLLPPQPLGLKSSPPL